MCLTIKKPVRVLRGHIKQVQSVNFSADNNSLISLGHEYPGDGIRFWDVETGQCYGGLDLPIAPETDLHDFTEGPRRAALIVGNPPMLDLLIWDLEK